MDEDEMELEIQHFKKVLKAFGSYKSDTESKLAKYKKDFLSLGQEDQVFLQPKYLEKLELVQACCLVNQQFLFDSVRAHLDELDSKEKDESSPPHPSKRYANEREQENLRSLLRQLVRDWSEEGKSERDTSYAPIMNLLDTAFPSDRASKKILVPGAGLGRLVYEISHAGFDCQGNEFSLFMLLPSEFMLNGQLPPKAYKIYPWIIPFSNHISIANQCRAVEIPDVTVMPPASGGEMSMTAGDFLQIYRVADERASWDAVVSCFFLDTAKNVVDYIATFYNLLKEGGIWINHGPLLYHFEGSNEVSIELSYEEIVDLAIKIGFRVESEESTVCPYAQDLNSMHQTIYKCKLTKFIK